MGIGTETWKWAFVMVLLAVFIVVGNQAYKSLSNPEDQFPPPNDYLEGDSYDKEHGEMPAGPGSHQPVEVPASVSGNISENTATEAASTAPIKHDLEPDWDKIKDPSQKK